MSPEPDHAAMSSDVLMKGTLRKAKSWNKRFFVLRDGSPPRLEYYENARKWKTNKPKRCISIHRPWNIDRKRDAKHEHLIVLFTEHDYFSMSAESADVQNQWIAALEKAAQPEPGTSLFKHVWHVNLENKELDGGGPCGGGLSGPHRVCLTHDTMVFMRATSSGGCDCTRDPVEIPITSIRVCGHKEGGMFFIEPGRSSGIGQGKLWMELNDEVVAAHMHTTILHVMYALQRQEEANARGRSYSSGSNSGRPRSHKHNPPPSVIGMGKVPSTTSSSSSATSATAVSGGKRNRCDSLPAAHVCGLQDNRLRTGSEGEHTMRRPPKYGGMSWSPAPRNRASKLYVRRYHNNHHHHPHAAAPILHAHTASLPGSSNSSNTSSTEQLNASLQLANYCCFPSASPTDLACDEYVEPSSGHSPPRGDHATDFGTAAYKQQLRHHRVGNVRRCMRCVAPYNCAACMSLASGHLRADYIHLLSPSEPAPPPPDVEPISLRSAVSSASSSHHNFDHSRTHSFDDSLCGGDPQQQQQPSSAKSRASNASSLYGGGGQSSPASSHFGDSSHPCTPASTSPKRDNPLAEANGGGDYEPMDFDQLRAGGKYPHQQQQQVPAVKRRIQPSPPSTFIQKLVSVMSPSAPPLLSEYTPMSFHDLGGTDSANGHNGAADAAGYVPMRPQSQPKTIELKRRRSVPDIGGGAAAYDASPDKCVASAATVDKIESQSSYYNNCNFKLQLTSADSGNGTAGHDEPDGRLHPAEDYLCMQPLQQELNRATSNGYLPMSPALISANNCNNATGPRGGATRKYDVGDTTKKPLPPQYPHQRNRADTIAAEHKTVAATLPSSSRKNRPKSMASSSRRVGSVARRTQSVRLPASSRKIVVAAAPPTRDATANGGEYVNIDFSKAQLQMRTSPYIIPSDGAVATAATPSSDQQQQA